MPDRATLTEAFAALDVCDGLLRKLDAGCCDPGRSPRMARLADTLADARTGLGEVSDDRDSAEPVLTRLEDAGAQLGGLQVACCTPKRMVLYAGLLERLAEAQMAVNRAYGTGH